ncbi:MAG: hypothetical protein IJ678_08200 [Kiritimatiellae bacterium]|nr:hypothetical protein [Kiritimatiellia bacterium]
MGLAASASADTYTIASLGSSSSPTEYSEPSNWTVNDEAATTCPGAGDTIRLGVGYTVGHLALDDDFSVLNITQRYNLFYLHKSSAASADTVSLTVTGTISDGGYQHFHVYDGVDFIVSSSCNLGWSYWDGGYSSLNLYNGGKAEIYGKISSRHVRYNLKAGSTMVFAPASYQAAMFSGAHDEFSIADGATLTVPNGLTVTGNAQSTQLINQNGGTVTFGGDFTSNTPWTYTMNAGTLAITDDVAFGANVALVVPASKSVSLDIASGKTFSAPGLSADSTASITVTGGGTFSIAPTTAPIVLQNGSLGLATSGTYDLSNVSLGSGASASIALTALGARVDSFPAALADATFTADLSSVTAGTVVFLSADADVLAKVQSDLASSVPTGFALVVSGETLSLEVVSDYVFDSTTVTDLLDASGWSTGSVPPDNVDVAIDGSGVVAEYTSGTIPSWGKIEVKNGATLRFSADATLPPVTLNKNATLDIASGTATIDSLTCTANTAASPVGLPVFSVQTNATISVASGMKFKNVDFRLYGTVTKAAVTDASPVFGYAESGETSYIAFTADGGTFDFHWSDGNDSNGRNLAAVSIACPASGGTVVPVGTFTLRNSSRPVNGWNDYGNWNFGQNNPVSVPVDVLVDGTAIDCSANLNLYGAVNLDLVNGACIRRQSSCGGHWFPMAIGDSATVTLEEGCYMAFTTGNGSVGIDSQSAVDTMTVRDGGIYAVTHNSSGWQRGYFVSDGGILGVTQLYNESRKRSDLLLGFAGARLDGDLTIASITLGLGSYQWDRHTRVANKPISGTGNVVVSNGVPAYPFSVTFVNGSNTATGSISADENSTVYFADGANWAGTVVANGNVKPIKNFASVTNLADGTIAAAPASVSFGGVQVGEGGFRFRVWQNGETDVVNVGAGGWSGTGKVVLEPQDFANFTGGEIYDLGALPSANAALPTPANRSVVFSVATVGEEGAETYVLRAKVAKGTMIILR